MSRRNRGAVKHKSAYITPPISQHLEKKVRFSLSRCKTGGQYCISKSSKNEFVKLFNRLGFIEELTWKQFQERPREQGLSIDKEGSEAYNILEPMFRGSDLYGHIRVNGTNSPFRVFVGKKNEMFYILLIDSKGKIHHR